MLEMKGEFGEYSYGWAIPQLSS